MSRAERLPRALRPAARAARRAIAGRSFLWESDGMGTNHVSPFLADTEWSSRYRTMAAEWYDDPPDVRWRMWILTSCARQAQRLDGSFAEFGTYRGGCAYMILATTDEKPIWLYDTFEGTPESSLTARERELGFGGRHSDTTESRVRDLLSEWNDRIHVVKGDVLETVPAADPGRLCLVHFDLNAAAPTEHVLPFAYERTVPGGVLVFDDYGSTEYTDQRTVVDAFLGQKRETLIALPTGQGVVIKQ